MIYKYPRALEVFLEPVFLHSVEEMHELLTVGVILKFGTVKIEAEHPVSGVDNILPRLEEWRRAIRTFLHPLSRRLGRSTISPALMD